MNVRRRDFITLLGSAAAAWPLAVRAQRPLAVIGFLLAQPLEQDEGRRRAFRQSLKDNGFIEGENVLIDYRFGGIRMERVPELLEELVRRRVAVIVVTSGPIAVLAAKASTTIPIVFLAPEDPVRLGLVASLAHPGGNMTGINFFLTELVAKRLGLLREMVPGAMRVGVLVNPVETVIAETTLREVDVAARAMGLQIQIYRASTGDEINEAFAAIVRDRPDGLFVSSGPYFNSRRVQLANLASRHAIPAFYSGRPYVEAGGLMSYGTDSVDWYREAGIYVSRILKGAKPADLPVVQSTKFELVINLQTAKLLGLTVSPDLLSIADEVIE
jgi:putative tryptophan/tyrosine transport system substrate-binding protein